MSSAIDNGAVFARLACSTCVKAHEGQQDAHGVAYAAHPITVASKVLEMGDDNSAVCVAYLHDIVEDTDYTLDDIRDLGFEEDVIEAIDAITRREEEPYGAYIDRVATNRTASMVKLADLEDNLDKSRGPIPGGLEKRYMRATRALLCARLARRFKRDGAPARTNGDPMYARACQCESTFELISYLEDLEDALLSMLAVSAACDEHCPPIVLIAVCEVLRAIDTDDLCEIVKASAGNAKLEGNRIIASSTDTPLGRMLAAIMRT